MKYIKAFESKEERYLLHPMMIKLQKQLSIFVNAMNIKFKIIIEKETGGDFASIESIKDDESPQRNLTERNKILFIDTHIHIEACNSDEEFILKPILDYIENLNHNSTSIEYKDVPDLISKLNKDDFELWQNAKKYNL